YEQFLETGDRLRPASIIRQLQALRCLCRWAHQHGNDGQGVTRYSQQHAEGLPAFRALAERAHRPLTDSEGLVGRRGGIGSAARSFSHGEGFAFGVWQVEAVGGSGGSGGAEWGGEGPNRSPAPRTVHRTADVCRTADVPGGWSGGVPDRVGGAARQDAHSVEREDGAGLGWAEPGILGISMIQIVPQMKILVAIEAVDGRKGIDSLARLCQEKLQEDPFSGCLFVFRSRRGTSIRILVYDGQGFWLAQKRLSKGRFVWWPSGNEPTRVLQAHQAQMLLAAGNPDAIAAPVWRRVSA